MSLATRVRTPALGVLLVTAALAGCVGQLDDPGSSGGAAPDAARAELVDTDGEDVGTVALAPADEGPGLLIRAEVDGLEPGFHGFHLHETAACQPSFGAAGGHHAAPGTGHGDHAGDLPVLLVREEGSAELTARTDRATLDGLFDGDGTAVVVHENPDNYANIPERYDEEAPDEATLGAGDAGPRAACGPLEAAEDVDVDADVPDGDARATLADAEGNEVGEVVVEGLDGGARVHATVDGLEPGFHGFHLHDTGACQPSFDTAGGHWTPSGRDHPDHAGDLPVLLVPRNGTARLTVATDRFTMDEATMLDGTAAIVHAGPDNYANVPDRYDEDAPDDETRSNGDSGPRAACGALRAATTPTVPGAIPVTER
jgi:Cu-Zn family superoxide dismutase